MSALTLRLSLVALLCVSAFALSGCQSIADQAAEKAAEIAIEQTTGAQIDQEDGSVTITGEDGTQVTASEGGELPEGFPATVPVIEGPVISSVKSGNGFMVIIETDKSVDEANDWYKEQLKDSTWKITFETKSADGAAIGGDSDNANLQVTISPTDAAKTNVSLLYAPKE